MPAQAQQSVIDGRESLSVSCTDGGRLHVEAAGSGDIPCVLIHGFADGAYIWDDFVRRAGTAQRLFSVDLRGHGESTWHVDGDYGVHAHVNDVVLMIESLRLRRCVLVGHSLGGTVALRVAALLPERVCGLVMVDTNMNENSMGKAHIRREIADSQSGFESVAAYAAWLMRRRLMAPQELLQQIASRALRRRADGTFELKIDPRLAQDADDEGVDLWPMWTRIACPVLLLRGAYSGVLQQQEAEQMVRELRQASLRVIPRAGHSIMIDNGSGFLQVTLPFLRTFVTRS